MFDLISCELREIAASETEFLAKLETEEQRREWLRSHLVAAAEEAGIERSPTQCFAFRTPPIIGGTFALSNLVPWDFAKYQVGTSKVLQQVADLPIGTQVITEPLPEGDGEA